MIMADWQDGKGRQDDDAESRVVAAAPDGPQASFASRCITHEIIMIVVMIVVVVVVVGPK